MWAILHRVSGAHGPGNDKDSQTMKYMFVQKWSAVDIARLQQAGSHTHKFTMGSVNLWLCDHLLWMLYWQGGRKLIYAEISGELFL